MKEVTGCINILFPVIIDSENKKFSLEVMYCACRIALDCFLPYVVCYQYVRVHASQIYAYVNCLPELLCVRQSLLPLVLDQISGLIDIVQH